MTHNLIPYMNTTESYWLNMDNSANYVHVMWY